MRKSIADILIEKDDMENSKNAKSLWMLADAFKFLEDEKLASEKNKEWVRILHSLLHTHSGIRQGQHVRNHFKTCPEKLNCTFLADAMNPELEGE